VESEGLSQLVREFCVIDSVEPGDYSGHAAVGYCELPPRQINPIYLGKVRKRMRMDLANVFSDIIDINSIVWANVCDIARGRFASIVRSLHSS